MGLVKSEASLDLQLSFPHVMKCDGMSHWDGMCKFQERDRVGPADLGALGRQRGCNTVGIDGLTREAVGKRSDPGPSQLEVKQRRSLE